MRNSTGCAKRHGHASQPSKHNDHQTTIQMCFADVIARRGGTHLRGQTTQSTGQKKRGEKDNERTTQRFDRQPTEKPPNELAQ